ncbi:MAG: tetratricopeptide repeat protein [Pseudomonadota bacterium]
MRVLRGLAALMILTAVVQAGPAQAVEDYDVCLDMITTDAAGAEREAGEWARFGGGAPARHCYALALIAIGAQSRGIDELLGIAAEEPDLEAPARADILIQAGELLFEEGDQITANVVAEQALRLDARNAGALALRARVKLDAGDVRAALRDLEGALKERPGTARFLSLRASAHRRLGRNVAARDDAAFATEQAPGDASAWLERGRAEAALKDLNAARYSFLEAIDLDREGEIGQSARRALQRMDAGITE